jgi:hypothetical protein
VTATVYLAQKAARLAKPASLTAEASGGLGMISPADWDSLLSPGERVARSQVTDGLGALGADRASLLLGRHSCQRHAVPAPATHHYEHEVGGVKNVATRARQPPRRPKRSRWRSPSQIMSANAGAGMIAHGNEELRGGISTPATSAAIAAGQTINASVPCSKPARPRCGPSPHACWRPRAHRKLVKTSPPRARKPPRPATTTANSAGVFSSGPPPAHSTPRYAK